MIRANYYSDGVGIYHQKKKGTRRTNRRPWCFPPSDPSLRGVLDEAIWSVDAVDVYRPVGLAVASLLARVFSEWRTAAPGCRLLFSGGMACVFAGHVLECFRGLMLLAWPRIIYRVVWLLHPVFGFFEIAGVPRNRFNPVPSAGGPIASTGLVRIVVSPHSNMVISPTTDNAPRVKEYRRIFRRSRRRVGRFRFAVWSTRGRRRGGIRTRRPSFYSSGRRWSRRPRS